MNSTVGVNRAIKGELLGVIGLEVALVVALHVIGGPARSIPFDDLGAWLSSTDATTALVAVARLAGLAIGYWLLSTTVLYAAAHRLGWSALVDLLRWVTLPVIRRTVHGVTAVSLTSASLLGPTVLAAPAMADDEAVLATDLSGGGEQVDTGYRPEAAGWSAAASDTSFWRPRDEGAVVTGGDTDGVTLDAAALAGDGEVDPLDAELAAVFSDDGAADDYEPGAAGWPARPGDGHFWRPDAVAESGGKTEPGNGIGSEVRNQAATTYVVEPDDNFWDIAEDHLRQSVGRSVTEDEVAQYWVRVVEANRSSIRSGDPDKIFAGEQLTLPEVYGG
jgi:hypothetical protein